MCYIFWLKPMSLSKLVRLFTSQTPKHCLRHISWRVCKKDSKWNQVVLTGTYGKEPYGSTTPAPQLGAVLGKVRGQVILAQLRHVSCKCKC